MEKLAPKSCFWSIFSKISSCPGSSPKHFRCILELIRSSYCVSERSMESQLWFSKIDNFEQTRDFMKCIKLLKHSIYECIHTHMSVCMWRKATSNTCRLLAIYLLAICLRAFWFLFAFFFSLFVFLLLLCAFLRFSCFVLFFCSWFSSFLSCCWSFFQFSVSFI